MSRSDWTTRFRFTQRRAIGSALRGRVRNAQSSFTLLELMLVIALIGSLAVMVIPNFIRQIERSRLPESCNQMRSVIQLTRTYAMYEGKRYRIRFLEEGEDKLPGMQDEFQPIIERENDPIRKPNEYEKVNAPWARQRVLLTGVRCLEIRLGKPTVAELIADDEERSEELTEELMTDDLGSIEELRPPLFIEADGTSEWVVVVITNAPPDAGDTAEDILGEDTKYKVVEVIYDGMTGLAWLQRPFTDNELQLLEENNWPAVLRKDFLDTEELTEESVREIQDLKIRK